MTATRNTAAVTVAPDNSMPTETLLVGAGVLLVTTAVISALLAAALHRFANRASVRLRIAVAGLFPVLLLVLLLVLVSGDRTLSGMLASMMRLGALPLRGYVLLTLVIATGLLFAWLPTRWLARRRERRQGAPVDTFA